MRNRGFTLIELMVVVVIIGILAAIAIPNFIAMQERGRQASVKGSLHSAQLCIEAYAVDANGSYPDDALVTGFGSYFPGGDEDQHTILGTFPNNPYSGLAMVAGDFNPFVYGATGDNSKPTIAQNLEPPGSGVPGDGAYGRWGLGGVAPWSEWGLHGYRKDGASIQTSAGGVNQAFLLHN